MNDKEVYAFNEKAAILALELDLAYYELMMKLGVKRFTLYRKRV